MSSFDWRKDIEDSIKDGLIITIAANLKPPKASLDAMSLLNLTGGLC